jgi:hypothetical protein
MAGLQKSVAGTWLIAGKAELTANIPVICSANISFPNIGKAGDTFTFSNGQFSDAQLFMSGSYTESADGSFAVDLSGWTPVVEVLLQTLAENYGITATFTISNCTLTGKALPDRTIAGTFRIVMVADVQVGFPLPVAAVVNGEFTGTPH